MTDIYLLLRNGSPISTTHRKIIFPIAQYMLKKNQRGCFVTIISGSGSILTLSVMCIDPEDIAEIKSYILENEKKTFDTVGIKIS